MTAKKKPSAKKARKKAAPVAAVAVAAAPAVVPGEAKTKPEPEKVFHPDSAVNERMKNRHKQEEALKKASGGA